MDSNDPPERKRPAVTHQRVANPYRKKGKKAGGNTVPVGATSVPMTASRAAVPAPPAAVPATTRDAIALASTTVATAAVAGVENDNFNDDNHGQEEDGSQSTVPVVTEKSVSIFKLTPVGLFCSETTCSSHNKLLGSSESSIVRHLNSHNIKVDNIASLSKKIKKELDILKKIPIYHFVTPNSAEIWKYKCNECDHIFISKASMQNHRSRSKKSGGSCRNADSTPILFRETIYGISVPETLPPLPSVNINPITNSSRLPELFYFDPNFVRFKASEYSATRFAIEQFIPHNELPDLYVPILQPIVEAGLSLAVYMTELITYWKAAPTTEECRLGDLIENGTNWLKNCARLDVYMVPGNLRAKLLLFDSPDLGEISQNLTFNFRNRVDGLVPELRKILSFIYRYKSPYLKKLVSMFRPDDEYFAARLLVAFHEETSASVLDQPAMVRYCASRCFRLDNGDLSMIQCGDNASTVASVLSICRAAACSVICSLKMNVLGQGGAIVISLNGSISANLIAPMIRRLREAQRRKGTKRMKTITPEGDVTVDSYFFPKSTWSQLIPTSVAEMKIQLGKLFAGNKWQSVLNTSVPINVVQDTRNDCHFNMIIDNETMHSSDFSMEAEFDLLAFDILCAHIMLAFHGFGLGSMRYTETVRMELQHVLWHAATMYYSSTHDKVFSHRTPAAQMTIRKLPSTIARVFLLFRLIVRNNTVTIFGDAPAVGSLKLAVPLRITSDTSMQSVFADMFGYEETPISAIIIRQLWASITSILFPDTPIDGLIATEEGTAEQSGHTARTDRAKYSSELVGRSEYNYRRYHQALGEKSFLIASIDNHVEEHHRLQALQLLYGEEANYRSDLQRHMCVVATKEESNCHAYNGAPTGFGKSLCWLIPTIARTLAGAQPQMIFVVAPYKLLTSFHYEAATKQFGESVNCSVLKIMSQDIRPGDLPEEFFQEQLPNLVFLSVDALYKLFKYHQSSIDKWTREKKIHRIFLDEIDTLFGEYHFRTTPYELYPMLPRLKVPIMIMSATVPTENLSHLLKYMNLTKKGRTEGLLDDVDVIDSSDKIGTFPVDSFAFNCKLTSSQEIASKLAMIKIKNRLRAGSNAIHVIVESKKQGEELLDLIYQTLGIGINVDFISAEATLKEQSEAAQKWRNGFYDILITTTLGIPGNESPRCKHVVILGYLYSLAQIIQAIGRVRQSKRIGGSVDIFAHKISKEQMRAKNATNNQGRFLKLRQVGLIPDDYPLFEKLWTQVGVLEWMNMESCFIQALVKPFGDNRSKCGVCNHCREENIYQVARNVDAIALTEEQTMAKAIKVMKQLKLKCLKCGDRQCNGESCLGRRACYVCGGNDHFRTSCPFKYSDESIVSMCFGCLDHTERPGFQEHGQLECPIQNRLHRLVIHEYQTKSSQHTFKSFVESIFVNRRSWAVFVSKFDT